MGYGQGDYGQGDYGQGDLFGFLGKVAKGLIGGIPVVGGAINAGIDAVGTLMHHSSPNVHLAGSGGGSITTMAIPPGQFSPTPVPSSTSTEIGYGLFSHQTNYQPVPGRGVRGMHIEKRGKRAGQLIPNRRMNITNPKALRRAIRRAHGFEKMARRVLGFTTPHKPKGRMYFRPKRRAKR